MLIERNDDGRATKGWYLQLAHAALPAIGFANQGVSEPHYHRELREVYLIARGDSTMVVQGKVLDLREGDVIVVEPGEVHTFTTNSPDYFHFVLHCPPIKGDKVAVP